MKNIDRPYQANAFCTIISKNYLAYARTLGKSIKQHHPNDIFFVLIVDKIENKFDINQEDFVVVNLNVLNIKNFDDFSFKYSVVELSTAVKPYLLEYLIDYYSLKKIIYLDPDIYVYQSLDYLFSLLDSYSGILTPHITQSYPEDNKIMQDNHILLSGLYNLGFIAISNSDSAKSLIKWWQNKLYEQCIIDQSNGLFVDQKWMDFTPIMFDNIYILKKSGYNIAYWNLHQNTIELKDAIWHCNNQPLYFYHFSGIQLDQLELISKYQTRFTLLNKPELNLLFKNYRQCLIENNYYECIKWIYTYDYYNSGKKISTKDRKAYYKLGKLRQNLFPNPFNLNIFNRLKMKIFSFFLNRGRNLVIKILKNLSLRNQDKIKIF
jgi:hypothetical protein